MPNQNDGREVLIVPGIDGPLVMWNPVLPLEIGVVISSYIMRAGEQGRSEHLQGVATLPGDLNILDSELSTVATISSFEQFAVLEERPEHTAHGVTYPALRGWTARFGPTGKYLHLYLPRDDLSTLMATMRSGPFPKFSFSIRPAFFVRGTDRYAFKSEWFATQQAVEAVAIDAVTVVRKDTASSAATIAPLPVPAHWDDDLRGAALPTLGLAVAAVFGWVSAGQAIGYALAFVGIFMLVRRYAPRNRRR